MPAVVVERARPPRLADLPGATYVEDLGTRRLAYMPNDPLVPKQWHLTMTRAFDYWDAAPELGTCPGRGDRLGRRRQPPRARGQDLQGGELRRRLGQVDEQGHGTFVAGVIAAQVDNASGIAGMAPSSELLVAKVVGSDNLIDVEAEARAIRWAVQNDARVINLSIGGFRDPRDPSQDAYSRLEAAAVGWAHGQGAVVVAAVGNSLDVPPVPWPYASYPAALPHVLGQRARAERLGASLLEPRQDLQRHRGAGRGHRLDVSVRATAVSKDCAEQGYSTCGTDDFRHGGDVVRGAAGERRSGGAALLRPALRPER